MIHHRNVSTKIEHLGRLSRAELRTLWEREFAQKPPPSLGRDILALGIAYARQERRYGGLARRVAKELDRLTAYVLRNGAPNTSQPAQGHSPEPAPFWYANGTEPSTT